MFALRTKGLVQTSYRVSLKPMLLGKLNRMASNRELRHFRLESFSQWFAKRVLELHPEWLPFVEPMVTEQDGLTVSYLLINFPSQNPRIFEPLTLSIGADKIITVSWHAIDSKRRWNTD